MSVRYKDVILIYIKSVLFRVNLRVQPVRTSKMSLLESKVPEMCLKQRISGT